MQALVDIYWEIMRLNSVESSFTDSVIMQWFCPPPAFAAFQPFSRPTFVVARHISCLVDLILMVANAWYMCINMWCVGLGTNFAPAYQSQGVELPQPGR